MLLPKIYSNATLIEIKDGWYTQTATVTIGQNELKLNKAEVKNLYNLLAKNELIDNIPPDNHIVKIVRIYD